MSPSGSTWYPPAACLWNGPTVLWTKPIISHAYSAFPEASKLFIDLLGLRDASCDDLLADLAKFRDTFPMPQNLERLRSFYEALDEMVGLEEKSKLR